MRQPKKPDPILALGPEHVLAIRVAALRGGRYWKSKLATAWYKGDEELRHGPKHGPLLRQIRNQLGPKWLRKFRIKELP